MAIAQSSAIHNLLLRHLENPFLVLEVAVTAEIGDIERQAQKLLAMLAAGLVEADRYPTPLGQRARTPELVRMATSELRDPARRLLHEFWACGWRRAS